MVRLARPAMGTRFEVVIAHAGGARGARDARAAGEEALGLIGEWHDRLSAFEAGSMVSRLNRDAGAGPVAVDQELFDLLLACERIRRASGGAFDAARGAITRGRCPGAAARATGGMGAPSGSIELDSAATTVRLLDGAEIDLGAIAKGGALDAALEALLEGGVTSALLHGGASTIVALGAPPGSEAWTVRLGEDEGAACVRLRNMCVSYSGVRPGGAGHVIDPRDGGAPRASEAGVCIGASALETDAWATALMVLGFRPAEMGPGLASAVLRDGAWSIEGPASGTIELDLKETHA